MGNLMRGGSGGTIRETEVVLSRRAHAVKAALRAVTIDLTRQHPIYPAAATGNNSPAHDCAGLSLTHSNNGLDQLDRSSTAEDYFTIALILRTDVPETF